MGNSADLSVAGAVDVGADLYVATFHCGQGDKSESGTGSIATVARIADRIQIQAGEEPSYAIVQIPMDSWPDEDAMAVAGVKGGPLDRIKLNSRASITHQSIAGVAVQILTGSVFRIGHDLGQDAGVIAIIDDRWLLSKVYCFGQHQYDYSEEKFYFVAADELIFNQGGWPNCIDSPKGPRFTPSPRYGWTAADTEEDPPGEATSKARSWRVSDAMKYLRAVHYESAAESGITPFRRNYGKKMVNDLLVIWPKQLGQSLSVKNGTNRAERVLHDFRLEGLTLLQSMVLLGKRSGPFELYCGPSGDEAGAMNRGKLSFISYEKTASSGAGIEHTGIRGGDLTTAIAYNSVQRGNLGEDIKDHFHEVIVLGDPPCVETLLQTNIDTPASATLSPAWTAAQETAWRAYINTNGKNRKAFEEACLLYPLVYAGYSMVAPTINPGFNPWTATKWEAQWKNRQRFRQKFRATLLTAINSAENPSNFMPREMPVEYSINDRVTWVTAQYYSNLQLSYDRTTIMLTALRDNPVSQTWKGSLALPLAIEAADIRLTAVIEADWRTTGVCGVGVDENKTEGRVYTDGGQHAIFSYLATTKSGDFIEWLRQGAYPVGQLIPAATRGSPTVVGSAYDFTDKALKGKELFTDAPFGGAGDNTGITGRIVEHAIARQRGLRRIKGGGQVVYKQFEAGFLPGARFSGVLDGMDVGAGVVRSMTLEANAQDCMLEIE